MPQPNSLASQVGGSHPSCENENRESILQRCNNEPLSGDNPEGTVSHYSFHNSETSPRQSQSPSPRHRLGSTGPTITSPKRRFPGRAARNDLRCARPLLASCCHGSISSQGPLVATFAYTPAPVSALVSASAPALALVPALAPALAPCACACRCACSCACSCLFAVQLLLRLPLRLLLRMRLLLRAPGRF